MILLRQKLYSWFSSVSENYDEFKSMYPWFESYINRVNKLVDEENTRLAKYHKNIDNKTNFDELEVDELNFTTIVLDFELPKINFDKKFLSIVLGSGNPYNEISMDFKDGFLVFNNKKIKSESDFKKIVKDYYKTCLTDDNLDYYFDEEYDTTLDNMDDIVIDFIKEIRQSLKNIISKV